MCLSRVASYGGAAGAISEEVAAAAAAAASCNCAPPPHLLLPFLLLDFSLLPHYLSMGSRPSCRHLSSPLGPVGREFSRRLPGRGLGAGARAPAPGVAPGSRRPQPRLACAPLTQTDSARKREHERMPGCTETSGVRGRAGAVGEKEASKTLNPGKVQGLQAPAGRRGARRSSAPLG